MEKSKIAILGAIVFVVVVGVIIGVAVHFTKDPNGPNPPGPEPGAGCSDGERTPATKTSFTNREHFKHCGDTIVKGNVPKGTQVTITEGDITIEGDALSQARITLLRLPNSKRKFTLTVKGKVDGAFIRTITDKIKIQGGVHNKGNITTTSGDVTCLSLTGSEMETLSGSMEVTNEIRTSKITTSSGHLTCNGIIESTVNSQSGNIVVHNQIQNTKIETRSGNINGKDITQSTDIKTKSGDLNCESITRSTVTTSSGEITATGKISHSVIETRSGDITCSEAIAMVNKAGDAIDCE